MNNVEAKFVLSGYRPNGADASDVAFAAAIEQAERDPALRAWFQREQEFDAKVAAKVSNIAPPPGLRDAILAGGRVSTVHREPAPVRRIPTWLAMAASVALIATIGMALWPRQLSPSAAFVQFAVADAGELTPHGGHGSGAGALEALLAHPATTLGQSLSINFDVLRTSGCRTLSFRGHDVLEVCFNRDGAWFHCYIAPRAAMGALAGGGALKLEDFGTASVARWADAAYVYVVVSDSGRAALQKLL